MMKKTNRNKKLILFAFFLIVAIVFTKLIVFHNEEALCSIAFVFDQPSAPHFYFVDKIYKLSLKKDITETFITHIQNNTNIAFHDLYIRILGVIGDKKSIPILENYYKTYIHDDFKTMALGTTIQSLGLIGDKDVAQFLTKIMEEYKDIIPHYEKSWFLFSLYLIDDEQDYKNVESLGEEYDKFYLTDENRNIKNVLVSTRGRERTLDEMIVLDGYFFNRLK